MPSIEYLSKSILDSDALAPIVFLVGPTGVGKSSLAIQFAQQSGREIVSADAYQVYQNLDILTGKPSAAELDRIPHHLIGTVPLSEEYSVAKYVEDAEQVLQNVIVQRGKKVLVVGGTGMYIKALTDGLSPLPPKDEALRERLQQQPLDRLVDELCRLDPQAQQSIDLNNPRRVVRALEICLLSGSAVSELRRSWNRPEQAMEADFEAGEKSARSGIARQFGPIRGYYLKRDREELREIISRRVIKMFDLGVVDEVRRLMVGDLELKKLSRTALGTLGLRDVLEFIRGQYDQETCCQYIVTATQQFAKRQNTWFRKQVIFEPVDISGL
jgi:tRNA dimethylallyltransferase